MSHCRTGSVIKDSKDIDRLRRAKFFFFLTSKDVSEQVVEDPSFVFYFMN